MAEPTEFDKELQGKLDEVAELIKKRTGTEGRVSITIELSDTLVEETLEAESFEINALTGIKKTIRSSCAVVECWTYPPLKRGWCKIG